ncbi:M50 family metallopeptidase [Pseudoxanthomonas sp. LARHCG66]
MIKEEVEAEVRVPSRLWSDGLPRWIGGRGFNGVMRALAWVVGIAALLTAAGALPNSHPLPVFTCLVMVLPAIAIHEAGHALAARWHGMRVIEMHIGLLNIMPLSRGLRWRLASPPKGVGGLVNSVPDPSRPLKPAMLWLMAGGPLANLVAALASLPPAVWGASPWSDYATAFLMINLGGFLANLVPFRGRHHVSDGWQWLQWRHVWSEGAREVSVLTLTSLSVWGVTAERVPGPLLRQIESLGPGGVLLVAWTRLKASQNVGDWTVVDEIDRTTTDVMAQVPPEEQSGFKWILAWLQVESAFSRAVIQRDARALLALPLGREMRWRAPHLPHRFAALACALDGNRAGCAAHSVRARVAAQSSLDLALHESEGRIVAHIEALLDPSPGDPVPRISAASSIAGPAVPTMPM